ncbi:MAG: methyltransferase domain-containing protein [Nitrospiraceae bacterium]|nr:MAG: methyltransferase domain-containing protein [Nitrospiraceae bacterium]
MGGGGVFRFLESLPIALKVWRELSSGDSSVGSCIRLMSRLDLLCGNQSAKRAIATEWANGLPITMQLSEKLPGRTEAICQFIKALPVLMQISRNLPENNSIFVQQFRELSRQSVNREEYLVDVSRKKRVLHYGFLDSPFSEKRIRSGELLHLKINNVASQLYGIDNDRVSLDRYRQLTGDMNNDVGDVQGEVQSGIASHIYDIILFPEILEHLRNPGLALANLKQLCVKGGKTKLCVTVPNAYYAGVLLVALEGDEIVHPEHYYYFSPATLRKLLRDAGFNIVEMALYASRDTAALPGITKNGVIAMCEVV